MRKSGDLRVKSKSRFAFLLRQFQLTLLVLSNVSDADFSAEGSIDLVFRAVDHFRQ